MAILLACDLYRASQVCTSDGNAPTKKGSKLNSVRVVTVVHRTSDDTLDQLTNLSKGIISARDLAGGMTHRQSNCPGSSVMSLPSEESTLVLVGVRYSMDVRDSSKTLTSVIQITYLWCPLSCSRHVLFSDVLAKGVVSPPTRNSKSCVLR